MKILQSILLPALVFGVISTTLAEEGDQFVAIYAGSDVRYDDEIGFEAFGFVVDDSAIEVVEGMLRRQFLRAPEGRSPLEILRNYEQAVEDLEGTILFVSRDPRSIEIDGKSFEELFRHNRRDYGLSTHHMTHTHFPGEVTEYLAARVPVADREVYVAVAAGPGSWGAGTHRRTFFELVTVALEPMEMGMVTVDAIRRGLQEQGRIAVYDILFDTGASEVKAESAPALGVIAEFLNTNQDQNVFVVGHTDSVGAFDMNVTLSMDRARAVVESLVTEHDVSRDQLEPYGVGPLAPIRSNVTEAGRALNRRVEIVAR